MPTFAACNKFSGRVTGLTVAKNVAAATKDLKTEGRTDNREIRELPERPEGWSLNTATDYCFPEYD